MQNNSSIKLSELYDAYFHTSYIFVKSYVHNKQAAEDIASDSIIKLYKSFKHENIENTKAFLMTILKNSALDYLRKESIRNRVHDIVIDKQSRELDFRISTLEECNPSSIFSNEIIDIINSSLSEVSEQSKRIFEMSRYEYLSNKEIAEKLCLSVKSIEYHITKVLALLRINLKDYLPIIIFIIYFL